MKESTRDKKIKELFKKNFSPEEIAKTLNIKVERVMKTLKRTYKSDKEKDFYIYFQKSLKIRQEIVGIYRKHGFLDSLGKIDDELNLQKGGL